MCVRFFPYVYVCARNICPIDSFIYRHHLLLQLNFPSSIHSSVKFAQIFCTFFCAHFYSRAFLSVLSRSVNESHLALTQNRKNKRGGPKCQMTSGCQCLSGRVDINLWFSFSLPLTSLLALSHRSHFYPSSSNTHIIHLNAQNTHIHVHLYSNFYVFSLNFFYSVTTKLKKKVKPPRMNLHRMLEWY